jgi:hypothetical protein
MCCLALTAVSTLAARAATHRLQINELELGIDEKTGSLVDMGYPATGVILESPAEAAGLLDLAYPVRTFLPLRLASRFSQARVVNEDGGVTITWDALAPSRSNIPIPEGKVFAQVRIRPAADGRSVIMTCRIANRSSASVPQVLFPDLQGLRPFEGAQRTQLRLGSGVVRPFELPVRQPESAPTYYDIGWKEFSAGSYYSPNSLRWWDYGSLRGGLSIFQRKWGTSDKPDVLTYRSEFDPMRLRMAWQHKVKIEPGQTWESGEFWLTPHRGGWAKGIEVYRNYVKQVYPQRALPQHVRDGLGFRTIYFSNELDPDPAKAAFRYSDIATVAQDAADHGLNELVMWGCDMYPDLPLRARKELGGMEELVTGVKRAGELGVNALPFATIDIVSTEAAKRYGVKPSTENWTYHPELIPQFRPYYAAFPEGESWVDSDNPAWLADVQSALTDWINRGIRSFCWDVFSPKTKPGQKPDLIALVERIRAVARASDPESTFGGESVTPLSLEQDGTVLDYTWNWVDYVDAGPVLNVLRAPRLNCNVQSSPLVAKKAFADSLYLNAMPRRHEDQWGTALIRDEPELAASLQEVARLRRQFLPYFVNGVFIGDSVLSEPTTAFVRGYQLGTKLLVIVLNDQDRPQYVTLQSALDLWLPSTNSYQIRYYDSAGQMRASTRGEGARWSAATHLLQPLELAFFEIEAP